MLFFNKLCFSNIARACPLIHSINTIMFFLPQPYQTSQQASKNCHDKENTRMRTKLVTGRMKDSGGSAVGASTMSPEAGNPTDGCKVLPTTTQQTNSLAAKEASIKCSLQSFVSFHSGGASNNFPRKVKESFEACFASGF